MGNTILEIKQQGLKLPFAVREETWSNDTYIVVLSVDYMIANRAYGESVRGLPFKNGNLVRLYDNQEVWRNHFIIPRCSFPVWQLVENIDLSNFERTIIYSLNTYFTFGKHIGYNILEILFQAPGYIDWFISSAPDFCLDQEASKFAVDKVKPENIELNNRKLLYWLSDRKPELIPVEFKEFFSPTFQDDATKANLEILTKPINDWRKELKGETTQSDFPKNRVIISSRMNNFKDEEESF